jgi:hypothetical protein
MVGMIAALSLTSAGVICGIAALIHRVIESLMGMIQVERGEWRKRRWGQGLDEKVVREVYRLVTFCIVGLDVAHGLPDVF